MGWAVGASPVLERPMFSRALEVLGNGHTRQSLLDERAGHGRHVTGGLRGPEVRVTTDAASGAGSLKEALQLDGPAWITFAPGLTITPTTYLDAKSDKTVDGRGSGLVIRNYPIRARGSNIIVNDLQVDYRTIWGGLDPLTVTTYEGPGHIEFGYPDYDLHQFWAHHLKLVGLQVGDGTFVDYLDEGVNTPLRTKWVTVSWCWFEKLGKVHICGNNTSSSDYAGDFITWHHNYFLRCEERQPMVRFARNLHLFNNWWKEWGATDGSRGIAVQDQLGSAVLIENNIFDAWTSASGNPFPHVYGGVSNPGDHKSVGNLLNAGCYLAADRNPAQVPVPDYSYTLATANQALRDAITAGAGPR